MNVAVAPHARPVVRPRVGPSVGSRRSGDTPILVRVALAVGLPFIAALTVAGTYLQKEVVIAAGWVAIGMVGFLFIRPALGLAVMTLVYMLSAYPTVLQSLGFVTINNLLGVGFAVMLMAHVMEHRSFEFLKSPPILVLIGIGLMFVWSSYHAQQIYPLLGTSRGKTLTLDRTDDFTHDFITRLVFLMFIAVFIRSGKDVRLIYYVFVFSLFAAVPSALLNWLQGNLNKGFRAVSSVTAGSNPNRLAMICIFEVIGWWCWAQASRGSWIRWGLALGCIGGSLIVLLATGSRSGVLGAGVAFLALQTGHRMNRISAKQMVPAVLGGLIVLFTIVPPEARYRMINFSPDKGEIGASSNKLREDTLVTAVAMIKDHPLLGIGLGNFREVSRQIYRDPFYRPPHNSPLWAWSEGGVFVLGGYVLLLFMTWQQIRRSRQLIAADPSLLDVIEGMRIIFYILCFFSAFADLWLNPITYLVVGIAFSMRRYLEACANLARPTTVRRLVPAMAVP